MQMEINKIAIALMESLAAIIFLLTILFTKQSRKISNRLKELKEPGLRSSGEGECWSYKWVMKNITMSRRSMLHPDLLGATLLIVGTMVLTGIFAFTAIIILGSLGYTPLLILVGLAMISDPEAYQAYNYVNAVVKVSIDQLNKEDEDYMRIAKEALERKALRFLTIAIIFAALGPFIPLIFNWLTYTLAVYSEIFFKATEVSSKISLILALAIILVVPAMLLFFPELIGRRLLSMLRKVFRRIGAHG